MGTPRGWTVTEPWDHAEQIRVGALTKPAFIPPRPFDAARAQRRLTEPATRSMFYRHYKYLYEQTGDDRYLRQMESYVQAEDQYTAA